MPDCCAQCKKPFPVGQQSCNWCDQIPEQKSRILRVSTTAIIFACKGFLFWAACVLAWFWFPRGFDVIEAYEKCFWYTGGFVLNFLATFLPTAVPWLAVSVLLVYSPILFISPPRSKLRYRFAILLLILVASCLVEFHHRYFKQINAGNFTVSWISVSHRYDDWRTRLSWKGEAIDLCGTQEEGCTDFWIGFVKDSPAWLIATREKEGKTVAFLLKDEESQYSLHELGAFDADQSCWRIDSAIPISSDVIRIGNGLWFDFKTESVLPFCELQYHPDIYNHDPDHESPILLSPDRRWVAFAHRDGLLKLVSIHDKQRFFSCYWVSAVDLAENSAPAPSASMRPIDWKQALLWNEDGVDFSADYHAQLLLAPPSKADSSESESDRAEKCNTPDNQDRADGPLE